MDPNVRKNKLARIPLIALNWVGVTHFSDQRFPRVNVLMGYFLTVIMFIIRNICEILYAYHSRDDLIAATSNSGTTALNLSLWIKAGNALVNRKKFNELFDIMNNDMQRIEESGEKEEKLISQKFTRRFSKIYWLLQTSTASTCTLLIIYYTVIHFISIEPGVVPHPLSVDQWYPFDRLEHNTLVYSTTTYYTIIDGMLVPCINCMLISLLVYVSLRLKVLQFKLRNRDRYILKARHGKQFGEITEEERYKFLTGCIEEHLNILKYINDLKNVIAVPMGVDYIIYVMIFVGQSVLFSKVPFGIQLIISICYLGTISTMGLLYYWHATEITIESSDLALAVYESPWIDENNSYKKAVMLMIQRANRDVILNAGLFAMNLDTFIMILRLSYSAFALMSQLSD